MSFTTLLRGALVLPLCLALVLATSARAQMTDSERASLARVIKSGDPIIVTTTDGREARGQLIDLQAETLRLVLDGRAQELPTSTVKAIEKRGDSVLNGALIGAAVLGLPMTAGAGASCSPDCGRVVGGTLLLGSALGAAIGALVDSLHDGRRVVYDARMPDIPAAEGIVVRQPPPAPDPRAVPRVERPARTERPMGGAADTAAITPVLSDLGARLVHRQMVSVTLVTGTEVAGRFFSASGDELRLFVKDAQRAIPAADIARVRIKSRRTAEGMLIGAAAMGGVGVATSTGSNFEQTGIRRRRCGRGDDDGEVGGHTLF